MLMLPIVVPFRRQVTSTPFDPFLVSRLLLGGEYRACIVEQTSKRNLQIDTDS